jgi:NADP-dependent 3-hydroxy acid dehydrogenase YdfG
MTDDAWRKAWEIDFFTAVRMCRAVVPVMRKVEWGRSVLVTSENAAQPYAEEAFIETPMTDSMMHQRAEEQGVDMEQVSFINGSNYRVDSGSVMTANY